MSEQVGTEEEGGLEEFAKAALRRPMRGSWESLLCQHLVQSVNSDILHKIRLICEAAYMSVDKTSIDMTLVDQLYRVALSLEQTKQYDDSASVQVSWSFPQTRESYDHYIHSWIRNACDNFGFTSRTEYNRQVQQKRLDSAETVDEKFWTWTTRISFHIMSFYTLRAAFSSWAFPMVMKVFTQLAELVQPELYERVLYAFTGKREQEE